MSAWTDARDNIRHGLTAMWVSFTPAVRAAIISGAVNFVLGAAFSAWVLL